MKKYKFMFCIIIIEFFIILSISLANILGGASYYVVYNGLYGIILSIIVPIFILHKNKEDLSSIGVKKPGIRQWVILIAFFIFSVSGQLVPLILNGTTIKFSLLPICIFPMMMTTFFEEFLFRGFIQTRIEKQFGWIVAILSSGLLFSLYHLGYPGFRSLDNILLLFAVGIGFAVAYKLSDNNLIVAYFVNLPNAFITYILKSEQFPLLTVNSSIFAFVTIILILLIVIFASKKLLHTK